MTVNSYDYKDYVNVPIECYNESSTLEDPDNLVFKTLLPDDVTETTYVYGTDADLVRDGVGLYHINFLVNAAGYWTLRIEMSGSGGPQGSAEWQIECRKSRFYT